MLLMVRNSCSGKQVFANILNQLGFVWKLANSFLRMNKLAIDFNFKNSSTRWHQLQVFDVLAEGV